MVNSEDLLNGLSEINIMERQTDLFQVANQKYCIDACALLDFWGSIPGYSRAYDVNVSHFQKLWKHIASEVDKGVIIIPKVIFNEVIKVINKEFKGWLDERKNFCVDDEDAQNELAEIVNRLPIYITTKASLHDAIFVATAKKRGLTVITSERKSFPVSEQNPKIPNVCEEVKVKWLSLVDYFKQAGL